ncbi:unnamed protein product [Vitrella brassicaformis CCMP3155]|uniref:Uncharacterized protein n=1 Tax=Vitrella brassicaformis (strain CCMP3155) TaxID=1169540 RepID=A0A0G4H1Q6_VITBC|nr:unnamed protein product [Vitrella brassicaformis CCMP3155]|eukprot:CEM37434.1 unnamed protein product [Vitrella brassicaformis CCMP3155]
MSTATTSCSRVNRASLGFGMMATFNWDNIYYLDTECPNIVTSDMSLQVVAPHWCRSTEGDTTLACRRTLCWCGWTTARWPTTSTTPTSTTRHSHHPHTSGHTWQENILCPFVNRSGDYRHAGSEQSHYMCRSVWCRLLAIHPHQAHGQPCDHRSEHDGDLQLEQHLLPRHSVPRRHKREKD